MDELQLPDILRDSNGPEPTPEVFRRIVARHHRRRARHYQVVAATSAAVIVLAGVGISVRLNDNPEKTKTALGPAATSTAPPGLRWAVGTAASGRRANPTGDTPFAPVATSDGAASSATAVTPLPGSFGFEPPMRNPAPSVPGATQPTLLGLGIPAEAGTSYSFDSNQRAVTGTTCLKTACGIAYGSSVPVKLFTRHVDGLTITATTVDYSFPVNLNGIVPVTAVPTPGPTPSGVPANAPTAAAGSTSTVPGLKVTQPRPVPVISACPAESELVVNVTYGSTSDTLVVPAGGTTNHAFSVVASAAAELATGGAISLAVARTNAIVAAVRGAFPGGGSDTMTPVGGWVVLAHRVAPSVKLARAGAVSLVARSASGHTLETVNLPATGSLATAPILGTCHLVLLPVNASSSATGPGGSSGSSGSGSGSGSGVSPPPVPTPSPASTPSSTRGTSPTTSPAPTPGPSGTSTAP